MRAPAALALAALLAMGSLVAWPVAGVAEGCPTPSPDLGAVRDRVQRDDGSPGDAGDCPGGARRVLTDAYHWGLLEPAAGGATDADDWYVADLEGIFDGRLGWVMVNVTADVHRYATGAYVPAPHVPFVLDLHAPGGATYTVTSCGGGVVVWNESGDWLFRIRQQADPPALCVGSAAPFVPPGAPPPGANYGFYFGCNPHCLA